MAEPIISGPGERISAVGPTLEVHEWAHGPMGGPPLHVHHSDDEAWHVLEGRLSFRFVDSSIEAIAGQTVFVPAGVAHTYGNPGPDDVRYLIISTPRVFELIQALHEPDASGDQAAIYRRFDSEVLA